MLKSSGFLASRLPSHAAFTARVPPVALSFTRDSSGSLRARGWPPGHRDASDRPPASWRGE